MIAAHRLRMIVVAAALMCACLHARATNMQFSDMSAVNYILTGAAWRAPIQQLGIVWGRMGHDFSWQTVEPTKGNWSFANLDAMVLERNQNGFKMLPILCYTADWAATPTYGTMGPAQNVADWENYVRTVVSRYIVPPYSIKYWQVWNEPTTDAWFRGPSNEAFIDQVHIPAARIIRELGGQVVFGGWPCNHTIPEYEAILNYNSAWTYTDYLDIHYFRAINLRTLYTNWVATGKVKGVWSTEVGWTRKYGLLPTEYPRVLKWALSLPGKDPDIVKLFWYASWGGGTEADLSFMGGPIEAPTTNATHGIRLKTLADLLAGGTIQARADLYSSPSIAYDLDETKDSLEAFSVAGRTVIAMHVRSAAVTPTYSVRLNWTQYAAPARIRRVSTTGAEQDLTFTFTNNMVTVNVPFSGLSAEAPWSGLSFVTAYVVADPPAAQKVDNLASCGGLSDGQMVFIESKTVSRSFGNHFYVQDDSPRGPAGIKISAIKAVRPGDKVNVYGALRTVNGERQVTAAPSDVILVSENNPIPLALGMTNESAQCAGSGASPGTWDGGGLYNTGILARLSGKVSNLQTTSFTLSDGSETPITVRVVGTPTVANGNTVGVTGVLACEASGDGAVRIVRTQPQDITVY